MNRADLELDVDTLRQAESIKWTKYSPEVLPLWVADMDFAIAPSIRKALHERLDRTLGYNHVETDPVLARLLREKMNRQSGAWSSLPEKNWFKGFTGVVSAIGTAVLGLSKPGDGVITMTPVYPPFLMAIQDHGRVLRDAPLKQGEKLWEIDWEALEGAADQGGERGAVMLLLCHPHNPVGRSWSREELAKLAAFAERRNLFVVTDELHADLTLDGQHVPFVEMASAAMRQRTITLTGPCKTYNTAGLGIGVMMAHDAALLSRVAKAGAWVAGHPTTMSVTMWKAALQDDGEWLAAVLDYLRENRDFLDAFVRTRLPGVTLKHVQATYLAWLDYRAHPKAEQIGAYLLDQAKVALNDGPMFGKQYHGFVRLNFATSRAILSEALERMAHAHS